MSPWVQFKKKERKMKSYLFHNQFTFLLGILWFIAAIWRWSGSLRVWLQWHLCPQALMDFLCWGRSRPLTQAMTLLAGQSEWHRACLLVSELHLKTANLFPELVRAPVLGGTLPACRPCSCPAWRQRQRHQWNIGQGIIFYISVCLSLTVLGLSCNLWDLLMCHALSSYDEQA